MFSDRNEAAQLLADRLRQYGNQNPLVLAIPRGAVPMNVIVVDDGLVTGATMVSALSGVQELADEVVCLEVPAYFQAVGQFYRNFPQVDVEEVVKILTQA